VFGQPDSRFPALLRVERDLQASPEGILVVFLPAVILASLIIGWVSFTRGELSVADSLALAPRHATEETVADLLIKVSTLQHHLRQRVP
jgi:hypothetical protein